MASGDETIARRTSSAMEEGEEREVQLQPQRQMGNPALTLSREDIRLLSLTCTGNFMDAYDYLVINPLSTMLQYELFAGDSLPPKLEGFLKSGTLIGSAIGQLLFRYLGDAFRRKAICLHLSSSFSIVSDLVMPIGYRWQSTFDSHFWDHTVPLNANCPSNSLIYLPLFRIIVGIGIGGDIPMSSSITADRTKPWKCGTVLSYIVSRQGWSSLVGSLVTIVVLAAYKHAIHDNG
ncbi:MFS general substrate transporter [Pleurotus eryngii]|uniref:MFS general substrate transporter n=1 Tax=Pleurotus eryngii TaxID=5323 RepID=A0A9P5ZS10_PLEER|nr:MFS general substrate transporter [Pleurotus eryngii]